MAISIIFLVRTGLKAKIVSELRVAMFTAVRAEIALMSAVLLALRTTRQ